MPVTAVNDIEDLVAKYAQAADLAHVPLSRESISYEFLPAPHRRPAGLPLGDRPSTSSVLAIAA
jgi:hypothetical protein